MYKTPKSTISIAKELGYSKQTIKKLKKSKSLAETNRIMFDARNKEL